MSQFQVPQFIETEDKIIGPLTLKQFGYLGIVAAIGFILYFILSPLLWLFITIILVAVAIGLAFGKVNGRPIVAFIGGFVESVWQPKIYIYKPSSTIRAERLVEPPKVKTPRGPRQDYAKPLFGGIRGLKNWIETSKTAIPKREKPLPRNFGRPQKEFKERYEIIRKMSGERESAKRVDFR